MSTPLLSIHPQYPDPNIIAQAATIIQDGGVIAFPTETLYGLAADAQNDRAIQRVFEIKNRPANKPILILLPSTDALAEFVTEIPPGATPLMAEYWPGALTLVFPAKPAVSPILRGGGDSIGIRIPPHPVALALLRACNCPLTAPSANLSGETPPLTAHDVLDQLDGQIDLILDAGKSSSAMPSTVIDVTKKPPRILRSGAVKVASQWLA
ncbi:MAG: threonylcarbamoyl-AMP synthase [Gemmatimonadetes bacterium]|nr:MAG: threonylcarbamoyl-AMP synthase [Gemmatimonadota bacterium]